MKKFDQIQLERFKFLTKNAIAGELIRADVSLAPELDGMIMRLYAAIWGESLKKVSRAFPLNWVEALKDRFLPRYFRKYFPVKYELIEIEVAALYPKFVLPEKDYGPMRVVGMDSSRFYKDGGPGDDY